MKLMKVLSVSAALILVLVVLRHAKETVEMNPSLKHVHVEPMEIVEKKESPVFTEKEQNVEMIVPRHQLVVHNSTRNNRGPIMKYDPNKAPSKLTSEIIKGVKKFVFFVGYPRSGHSIIGTIMDAHPHVVIANEFFMFNRFYSHLERAPERSWTANLMNKLYQKSINDANLVRASSKKGYTLNIDGLWQGNFNGHIEVIGDKSGGRTTENYLQDKVDFKKKYQKLKYKLSMPIRIIHGLRNPFDMIATHVVIMGVSRETYQQLKQQSSNATKLRRPSVVDLRTTELFSKLAAVVEMIDTVLGPENVLEVHNNDLVSDPRGTITNFFNFLGVRTTEQFLDICSGKIFKSMSRTRDLVEWTPQQVSRIEQEMKKYKMLSRYSFTSD